MSYPQNFIKVTFGGTVYEGSDIWSCGINFGTFSQGENEINAANLGLIAQLVSVPIENWFKNGNSRISNNAKLEWVKVAVIDKNGKYSKEAGIHDYGTAIAGGTTSSPAPQLTTVMTMESSKRRAPGRFARIYPPLCAPALQKSGRIAPNDMTTMIQHFARFLQDATVAVRQGAGFSVTPIVASQLTDDHNEVKSVKMGDVIDTQRTRRNAFKETYTNPIILSIPQEKAEPEPEG